MDPSEGDGVRGEYAGDFPGVVRPMLRVGNQGRAGPVKGLGAPSGAICRMTRDDRNH